MATRIHVTALRGAIRAEVRATFTEILGGGFEAVPVHEYKGWIWFTTSVWGVSGVVLNKGLCRLAVPALQFTTADDARWYLTVHGGPQGTETFLHDFGYFSEPADPADDARRAEDARRYSPPSVDPALAFLEDEPETPPRPRAPFDEVMEDFADCGAPLPGPLCEQLHDLPYSEAVRRLHAWHAEAVVGAMERAGLEFDAQTLERVLLWEDLTRHERDGSLGNLPRLLSVLGLGGEWDEYLCQAVEVERRVDLEPASEAPPPPPDYAREVLELVEELPLFALEGRPVRVPVKNLACIGFAAEACSTWSSPMMAVFVSLPGQIHLSCMTISERTRSNVHVTLRQDGFRLGLLNRMWYRESDLEAALDAPLLELLLAPPDGTVLEAAFAVAGEPATYQRFRGTVINKRWRVDQSYPALTSEALAGMIATAADESKARIRCRDVAEATAVEQAARRSPHLHNMNVKRQESVVSAAFDTGNLAKLLLRHRYPDAWDFGPAQQDESKEYADYRAQSREWRRAGVEAARRRAIPHSREALYAGRRSRYYQADIGELDQLEPEPRQQFDGAMASLGFQAVGDLVASRQRDILLHLFVNGERLTYAVLMAKRTMYFGFDFVSRLADDSLLTTTTNGAMASVPDVGVYYRSFPGRAPEALYEKHGEGLERFRRHKNVLPVTLDPTLAGAAREIEMAFERREAAEGR